jgi:transposase-like protein
LTDETVTLSASDAEEYTQGLSQIGAGWWRQIALGFRLGVPEALGLEPREWVEERLGGYMRQSIPERQEAVKELAAEGHTQSEIADTLGVTQQTISRDLHADDQPDTQMSSPEPEPDETAQADDADDQPDTQMSSPEPESQDDQVEAETNGAVEEFLNSDVDLNAAKYRLAFIKAIKRSDAVFEFDPKDLAGHADQDLIRLVDEYQVRVTNFAKQFHKAVPGLRAVRGE